MKIDTEATEYLVVRGGPLVLEHHRPVILCEVLPNRTEDELYEAIEPYRYRYFWIAGDRLVERQRLEGDPTYENSNYLFMPRESWPQVQAAVSRSMTKIVELAQA
jgi:hypothetical protein